MMSTSDNDSRAAIRCSRLNELLARLARQGFTQQAVATQAGVPNSYISDIKAGRRNLSELFARRLGEEFNENYQWLLGLSDVQNAPQIAERSGQLAAVGELLEGSLQHSACWDGSFVAISPAVQQRAALASNPYLLRLNHADTAGRLRAGDLILISQTVNPAAEVQVVKQQQKLLLARQIAEHGWQAVNPQVELTGQADAIGHCVGIVWGQL